MITFNTQINHSFHLISANSQSILRSLLNNSILNLSKLSLVTLIQALLLTASAQAGQEYQQSTDSLLQGKTIAVAYSGFRDGQHPDRGNGAINPTELQILEDLQILLSHDLSLIRLYDSGENSATILKLIKKQNLPIKVLLGIWLEAEVSNHLGCPWLEKPITESILTANKLTNTQELLRGISLANTYSDIVIAVNVGNEALVDWNDHMVTLNSIIGYVRQVKLSIDQPVTVADNYEWWIKDGASLAAEVDFIGVHTYPAWENKPIAILEGGWATTAKEFALQANEANQKRYFDDISQWAKATNTTFFFFEAFDEPWKGNPANLDGAEKHWGLFNVDRTPKKVMLPK